MNSLDQMLVSKFHAAKNSFDAAWKHGAYEWLQGNSAGSMVAILMAEQQLDEVWSRARVGAASVQDFDAALGKWTQVHAEALKEFNARRS